MVSKCRNIWREGGMEGVGSGGRRCECRCHIIGKWELKGANLSFSMDSLGDGEAGRRMVAGLQCGDDRMWELITFNG